MTGVIQDGGRGKGSIVFIPDDLQEALASKPAAQERFESLSDHLRYLHVKYVSEVVEPHARQSRIQEIIALLQK